MALVECFAMALGTMFYLFRSWNISINQMKKLAAKAFIFKTIWRIEFFGTYGIAYWLNQLSGQVAEKQRELKKAT